MYINVNMPFAAERSMVSAAASLSSLKTEADLDRQISY